MKGEKRRCCVFRHRFNGFWCVERDGWKVQQVFGWDLQARERFANVKPDKSYEGQTHDGMRKKLISIFFCVELLHLSLALRTFSFRAIYGRGQEAGFHVWAHRKYFRLRNAIAQVKWN